MLLAALLDCQYPCLLPVVPSFILHFTGETSLRSKKEKSMGPRKKESQTRYNDFQPSFTNTRNSALLQLTNYSFRITKYYKLLVLYYLTMLLKLEQNIYSLCIYWDLFGLQFIYFFVPTYTWLLLKFRSSGSCLNHYVSELWETILDNTVIFIYDFVNNLTIYYAHCIHMIPPGH